MKNSIKKIKHKFLIKKYIFEMFQIIIGSLIMALGTSQFLLPAKLSSGGFTGIATIIYYLFKWKMGYTILIINIPFFILAFIKIGKKFVFKSIFGTVFLSFFIDVLDNYTPLTTDRFLSCIYGRYINRYRYFFNFKSRGFNRW